MTDGADIRTLRPKHVGARVPRTEDPRLLTGKGQFVDDRNAAGQLHVAFRRSEHSHARIVAIDCEAARSEPGVIAVLTADDLTRFIAPVQATSRMKGYYATPIEALARGKVRYAGEPVVAVVATSRYLAEDAARRVDVEFTPLPTVIDPEAAVLPGAALLHEAAGSNVIVAREFRRGEVETQMAAASVRVRQRFRMHRKTPAAMEPRSYLADYDGGRDELTLRATTQVPGIIRNALAEALGMPGSRLRVIAPDVGGGFGGKGSLYPEELLVCAAARLLEQPVKWTSDRAEDLVATSHGFDEIVDAEIGVAEDGRIVALTADVIGDIGAYSIYPWTAGLEPVQVVSFLPGPYRIDAYRGAVKAVATSKAPTGPYRGVGRPISTFAMEGLIDIAARRLGLDPKEMRLRNLVRNEEFPYKAASGLVWDRSAFVGGLEAACEAIGYAQLRQQQSRARAAGCLCGIGIATYAELTGLGSRIAVAPGMPLNTGTETARIMIDATGGVTAAFGVAAHGQGHETALAQIIADDLGVAIADIRIIQGDSAAVPNATGSFASRSTVLAGGAARIAAREVRSKVMRAAAHLLEADTDALTAEDGRIGIPGSNRSVSFKEVARAVYLEMSRLPPELREELSATGSYDPVFGTTSSATHIATVEIDAETGEVRLERYVVAEDCGRLVNPMIVDGQVHGGVAQGIGAALYEEVVYDEHGQCLTGSLADYVLPGPGEVPAIAVFHLETEAPTIGGFRGMGEGGTIGAPAAVANAIADALSPLDIIISELPATPVRVFELIKDAKAKRNGERS
ncbi:MAG: xanthine dehydrogenase family protein molybdopterin-binding subunit [Hyphomicrobiaceae bacterium]